jgi:hypothetical protein
VTTDTFERRPSFRRILLYCAIAAFLLLIAVAAIGPLFTYGVTYE